jgi:hypothetical protein
MGRNGFALGSNITIQQNTAASNFTPAADDGSALGTTALKWSDLFLASGAVVNFNNGNVTVTHSANTLAFAGAASGYTFTHALLPSANDGAAIGASGTAWSDVFLAAGAVINWDGGAFTATQAGGVLTFSGQVVSGLAGSAFSAISGNTAQQSFRLKNTTGEVYFGIESSAAGGFFTGSSAYATVIYSPVKDIEAIVAGTKTLAVSATAATVTGNLVAATTQSPASGAAGVAGTITWDASYIYVCTASGAWKRAALTGGY